MLHYIRPRGYRLSLSLWVLITFLHVIISLLLRVGTAGNIHMLSLLLCGHYGPPPPHIYMLLPFQREVICECSSLAPLQTTGTLRTPRTSLVYTCTNVRVGLPMHYLSTPPLYIYAPPLYIYAPPLYIYASPLYIYAPHGLFTLNVHVELTAHIFSYYISTQVCE